MTYPARVFRAFNSVQKSEEVMSAGDVAEVMELADYRYS
jgi:hypothetical protein